ncbi:hypothetical protein LCGC14_1209640 [marine sediment metagenome]|uniref:Uncharacterized protein n=1 Tax=marine sediment metagenome TaxID=412755 RepID=A0A0F9PJ57_9ZZZZ
MNETNDMVDPKKKPIYVSANTHALLVAATEHSGQKLWVVADRAIREAVKQMERRAEASQPS